MKVNQKKIESILMPIYSLPTVYGVGEFSKEAFNFIDFLSLNKVKEWNILSPYDEDGLFNIMYISLDDLFSRELIGKPIGFYKNKNRINYNEVYRLKNTYYFEAYCNYLTKHDANTIKEFGNEHLNLKKVCEEKAFNFVKSKNEKTKLFTDFYLFMQMILFQEWDYLLKHANDSHVKINIVKKEQVSDCFSILDLLHLKKKFSINELNEVNPCFKLKNFKKTFKLIKKVNHD